MAEVQLLGAVELRAGDQPLDLGPPKQRAVFAALVVDAGRPVRVDTLLDRVWGEAPPNEARNALYAHSMRIRRLLARVADLDGGNPRLDRRPGGYLLDIDRDQVDLHRFHRLVDQARGHPDDTQRAKLLREALHLWRDTPVADLPGPWFARQRDSWHQHWLDAIVAWAQAELRLGNHDVVIQRLHDVVADHPLVEPLAAAMMRSLHAAGRGAEALDHFAAVRQRLADELGTDPGPALQQVHQAILRGEPDPAPPAAQQVPRQLPAPPQMFTGREPELAALDHPHDGYTVVISAIDGMAGVGKTALALHTAHLVADRYPDGQLFVDLHGHTPGMSPRAPGEVLDLLLRSLDVRDIPAGLEERAALYRTRLADQRLLIVLDNAASEAQVLPLLPGASGCLVLVTSRHRLAGLDHTRALSLDTLPTDDGVALLVRSAGPDRLRGQPPESLADLVELCGRLPLAIRIAAARLRAHPAWDVSHLLLRLRDRRDRLAELDSGQRGVTAALDVSYQHLTSDQQHAYRALGQHPGGDIDAYAVAALLGSSAKHALRMVDQLIGAHLLHEPVAGRYRFHDLVRAHAAHLGSFAGDASVRRLLDHYGQTALLAVTVAYPHERGPCPPGPATRAPSPALPTSERALDWLDTELANLTCATEYATEHGELAYVLHMSTVLHPHLRGRLRYREAEALHRQALAAARALGISIETAHALDRLGDVQRLSAQYSSATDTYREAVRLARSVGDRRTEVRALIGSGQIMWMQSRHAAAAEQLEHALRVARAHGEELGELHTLSGLGEIYRLQGRIEQATDHFRQSLRIARTARHPVGQLNALNGLGRIHRARRRFAEALECFGEAERLAESAGHRLGRMEALNGLGDIHRSQGEYELADVHYGRLLELADRAGDRNVSFEAHQAVGRLRYATGDLDAAVAHHDRALALASELRQPLDEARAHDGLAHAYHGLGRTDRARDHWRRALTMLTELGVDTTDDENATTAAIRANLATLDRSS
jgi:DNA-binding SARP family transcriptional activator/tetratricopeptide (TPR) repeat protein